MSKSVSREGFQLLSLYAAEAREQGDIINNRSERRRMAFGDRRHRKVDGTVATKPTRLARVTKNRAAAKRARAARKANR